MHCLGLTVALGFVGFIMFIGALAGPQKTGSQKPPPSFMDEWGILLILAVGGIAFWIWVLIERRKNSKK